MTFAWYRWLPALTVLGTLAAAIPVQAAPGKSSCQAVLICGAKAETGDCLLLHDGIGLAQASNERAPTQLSMTCARGNRCLT